MIAAVLVIPASGDPAGLLREGVYGARPPYAWRTDPTDPGPGFAVPDTMGGRLGWSDPERTTPPRLRPGSHGDMYVYRIERALVLAWATTPVREGRDRALYALAARYEGHPVTDCPTMGWTPLGWSVNVGTCSHLPSVDGKVPAGLGEALVVPWLVGTLLVQYGLADRVVLLDETGAEVTT